MKHESLIVRLDSDPPGVIDSPASPHPAIVIHVGPSVHISCSRGGLNHRGVGIHGDIDIIPPGVPSRWEIKEKDTALILSVHSKLLRSLAEDREIDLRPVEIVNRFQTRDPQIEHIGWALKAEMEARYPAGRLYLDSLATALGACLLERHSSISQARDFRVSMSGKKLRQVISYIEDNLARDLSLGEVASVAGIGISHLTKVFRESVGLPVHQYVIARRVERAKMLLHEGKLSIGEIAAETGFAHQSHLARHMRRVAGISPKQVRSEAHSE